MKQGKPPRDAVHNIHGQLTNLAVPIDEVNLDPSNARSHDRRNLDSIVLSLREHGQRVPIVVQEQGATVRAGNGRVLAMRQMGWRHVGAVLVDEWDAGAGAYAIRDNRAAELAEWNLQALGAQLRYLDEHQVSLDDLGWQPHEYEPLMAAEWSPPQVTDESFHVGDRRVSMLWTQEQWDDLTDLLSEKPNPDLILARLRETV